MSRRGDTRVTGGARGRALLGALILVLAPGVANSGTLGSRLLGDPGGHRSRLERLGVGVQLFYNQFLSANPRGGAEPESWGHSGSYDLFLRVDAEELVGWPDATAVLHVKGLYDRNINAQVGALSQPIDDADFDEAGYVDELWVEQGFLRRRVRVRVGLLEQQTAFDRNAWANSEDRQFLAAFLDNNPLVPLPNGLGAVVFVDAAPWLTLAAGVSDADNVPRRAGFDTAFDDFDGLTGHFEAAFRVDLARADASGRLPGRYRLGLFVDGRDLTVFGTGRSERSHLGVYASLDQLVFREAGERDEGLGLFARAGWADPDSRAIEWFWSVGGLYRGPIPGRDRDELGLGVYQAIGSRRFERQRAPGFDRETGFELFYKAEVLPWLMVTPDVQLILDPGARGEHSDAWVATLRLRVAF